MWLREAHWEEHVIGAAHNNLKKNKDNKKKHKRVHHKAGKKHQKKRSIQKKAGLPAIPEWDLGIRADNMHLGIAQKKANTSTYAIIYI